MAVEGDAVNLKTASLQPLNPVALMIKQGCCKDDEYLTLEKTMFNHVKLLNAWLVVCLILLLCSCKKETFITSSNALLSITADTVHFDTVFTSVGSITQSFKIINNNRQKLRLSSVRLKGGAGSAYKINIDGTATSQVNNVELEANDSIYVFVTISINPNLANLPFIVRDSIEIAFNANLRYVQLEAWGQNANFLRNRRITGNTQWNNKLPYVILGGLQIDTSATLTIDKGCRIFLHADAPFLVDGTLIVNGEKADSARVYFKSDRLDIPYNEYPGSWPGIYFRATSKDNLLQFAVIQHAYQGVVAELPSVNANPKVTLNECIINNIYDAGVLGIQTSINARNCLISNCGAAKAGNGNVALLYGGNYKFTHCTVAGISNSLFPHLRPVLSVTNFINQNNTTYMADLSASFTNCIFWGDSLTDGNEVQIDRRGTNPYNVQFNNCLWRQKSPPALNFATTNSMINVQGAGSDTTLFITLDRDKRLFDFRLQNNSPAINKGINTGIPFDLDGKPRANGLPDIGCYEKQ